MDEREAGLDGASRGPADGGTAEGRTTDVAESNGGPNREQVLEALRNVYDPELGINIVDLGLVYDVEVRGGEVDITYTLTTMGCPIGPLIEQQMQQYLLLVQGVEQVHAEMVLRPPWSPEMMSDEAKAALGYF
ncbi:MAG TPA: metal-sulfur cluster assembly factor [Actinomycetota bacterium]|nr:metal-sulfur cluster assembly factor [Actinomycetota bacterium]